MAATATADAIPAAAARASRGPERLPGRLCAGAALASIAAHVWMAWAHRAMPWESGLMLLMAAACLPCAVSVWRGAHDRAVPVLFAMALAMVGVHAALLLLSPGAMAGHRHGSMGAMAIPGAAAQSRTDAMLGVIALELVVALLAARVMRRERCRGAHRPATVHAAAATRF